MKRSPDTVPAKSSTGAAVPVRPGRTARATSGAARTASRQPPASAGAHPRTEHSAYDAISKALLEGKLRPGTPLRERYLAEVFGVTRGAVRKVLLRLGQEGKLQILANRGAYVPQPSSDDVRQVYDARKAVEAGLVTVLASRINAGQLTHLRAHVRNERRAQRQGRRDESIKLSGAFHVELVNAFGNTELTAFIQRLVSRTQMFVALFEAAHDSGCAADEHEAIVAALSTQDGARAAAAMLQHLHQVEARVHEHVNDREPPDLGHILRSALPSGEDRA